MSLEKIRPREHQRVMDLVAEAGVDVSDWANFKGGAAKAAVNPKYCYEWAFVEAGVVVVLNIWFEKLQFRNGEIFQELNLRRDSLETTNPIWAKRAQRFDSAVQKAWRNNLPLRVIVCDGMMREGTGPATKASKVKNRLLDPESWFVTEYDWMSGSSRITRGAPIIGESLADNIQTDNPLRATESVDTEPSLPFVDQFSTEGLGEGVRKRTLESEVFERSAEVRRLVLNRAGGRCEYCGAEGFQTAARGIYLETHHVVPLSESGPDTVTNVVAVCPNHHREAHYGEQRDTVRTELLAYLVTKSAHRGR